jgi:hypothetical protein
MINKRKLNTKRLTEILCEDELLIIIKFLPLKQLLFSRTIDNVFNYIFKKYKNTLFKQLYKQTWNITKPITSNNWIKLFKKKYTCKTKPNKFSSLFKKLIIKPKFTKEVVFNRISPLTLYKTPVSTGVKLNTKNYFINPETVKVCGEDDYMEILISNKELESIGFNGPSFTLVHTHSEGNFEKMYSNEHQFFTVREIIKIIEDFDLIDRNLCQLGCGEIDVERIFFEGFNEIERKDGDPEKTPRFIMYWG